MLYNKSAPNLRLNTTKVVFRRMCPVWPRGDGDALPSTVTQGPRLTEAPSCWSYAPGTEVSMVTCWLLHASALKGVMLLSPPVLGPEQVTRPFPNAGPLDVQRAGSWAAQQPWHGACVMKDAVRKCSGEERRDREKGRRACFPAPEPSKARATSPRAVPNRLPVTSRLHFTNSFLRETSRAQGGRISVSLSLGGGEEKGRRGRRGSGRPRPGCGKQLVENGKLLSLCARLWQASCLRSPGLPWGCAAGQAGRARAREPPWGAGFGLGALRAWGELGRATQRAFRQVVALHHVRSRNDVPLRPCIPRCRRAPGSQLRTAST